MVGYLEQTNARLGEGVVPSPVSAVSRLSASLATLFLRPLRAVRQSGYIKQARPRGSDLKRTAEKSIVLNQAHHAVGDLFRL